MRYFGLKEPDYSEITYEFWYKLPLCLEYIKFLQREHFEALQGNKTLAASGSTNSHSHQQQQ